MALDILNMSDEDLLKLDPASLVATETTEATNTSAKAVEEATQLEGDTQATAEDVTPNGDAEGEGAGQGTEAGQQAAGEASPDAGDAGQATQTQKTEGAEAATDPKPAEGKDDKPAEPAEAVVDYKAAYEKLTAPFTANGREMSVKSVDDALTLMKMGANYNKKMAALKPGLKILKLLENNGLLDEDKIGFLIDLEKKDPAAINKLVAESKIDPMDLDSAKAGDYRPSTQPVSDQEIELDSVLDDLKGSTTIQKTLQVVTQEWDKASKQVVANNPQLLRVLDDHQRNGVFGLIKAEVDRERMLGRLNGVSDIEAYRQVGDSIQARGGFAHLSAQGQQTTQPAQVVVPNPKKAADDKRKEMRRAASPAKPAVSASTTPKDFNPLALSDDEFSKLVKPNFF